LPPKPQPQPHRPPPKPQQFPRQRPKPRPQHSQQHRGSQQQLPPQQHSIASSHRQSLFSNIGDITTLNTKDNLQYSICNKKVQNYIALFSSI
jgi:hypothetical protein